MNLVHFVYIALILRLYACLLVVFFWVLFCGFFGAGALWGFDKLFNIVLSTEQHIYFISCLQEEYIPLCVLLAVCRQNEYRGFQESAQTIEVR